MAINYPNIVKIAIIYRAPVEALESNLEEFTYQVGEEVGDDFDNKHEGEDVVLNRIR